MIFMGFWLFGYWVCGIGLLVSLLNWGNGIFILFVNKVDKVCFINCVLCVFGILWLVNKGWIFLVSLVCVLWFK